MDQGESAQPQSPSRPKPSPRWSAAGKSLLLEAGGLSVDDAYRVTPLVRQLYEAGGAKVIGRKIGFTNRTIWPEYGVYAPIWGYVFDRSVHDLAARRYAAAGCRFPSHASSPKSCSAFRLRPRHRWTRRPCRHASNGSHSASRSCSRSFRGGNFPRLIRLPPTACTGRS